MVSYSIPVLCLHIHMPQSEIHSLKYKLHIYYDMESLQRLASFLQEASQEANAEQQDIHNTFNGLVKDIQALGGNQPEAQAQAVRAIQSCRSLEAMISRLLREKQNLEETNKQMQLALSREQAEYEQLLQRYSEQEVTLSCFQGAFPVLQEGLRDLRGAWESIGTPGVYHTA